MVIILILTVMIMANVLILSDDDCANQGIADERMIIKILMILTRTCGDVGPY